MVARNIRVAASLLALVLIVTFFVRTQNSFSNIDVLKPGKETVAPETDHNTLQGKPYKGEKAPFDASGSTGGAHADNKVGASKITQDQANHDSTAADKKVKVEDVTQSQKDKEQAKAPAAKEDCKGSRFVVMIDAGSTGSRVHVYEFDTCQSPPALLNETFKMLEPGLSSFNTDATGAAKSLDPLLKIALDTVPKDKQGCTPVAVKATAGLRLLGEEKSKNILGEVRKHLENDFPFAVVPGDGVSIMDGKDEGVYAWVTANYLLGNIGASERLPTAAVFDLGGGSTQIVFEPELGANDKLADGDHKYEFTFGKHKFALYQFSHLGYGLMQGRNKINSLVVKSTLPNNQELAGSKKTNEKEAKSAKASVTINNPCVPPGVTAENVVVSLADNEHYVVNMKGPSVANGAQCRFLAEKVLNKETECKVQPCSFNGVYQPSLNKAFKKSSDMFVFSYFYDRTNPLGFPSSFTVEELKDLAKIVCNGDTFWKEALLDDHIKHLNKEPQWCLDLSFITAMLHTGYDIPLQRELKTAKTINNNELGWCLGASLPLLDQGNSKWKCKIADVTPSN
ncbi:Piso0_003519 [Millerozyma farinosa CBS 7064]|uniref:guanosine-diphosphatase n=1 Tax=Pichia sorbitophila (strain ATCC MYA-4447 / BCRC 22081 / CBS 7064 / NBRC 10061 / NRRL Y-12695) TaxID=559304 RepID=G8YJA8_PICSO|nr:Piso0_003519 [Millerozyma farinosa CBS 7064]CCE81168.1 Piso0_003519 [Millerozyma farinosa CBS 7064]